MVQQSKRKRSSGWINPLSRFKILEHIEHGDATVTKKRSLGSSNASLAPTEHVNHHQLDTAGEQTASMEHMQLAMEEATPTSNEDSIEPTSMVNLALRALSKKKRSWKDRTEKQDLQWQEIIAECREKLDAETDAGENCGCCNSACSNAASCFCRDCQTVCCDDCLHATHSNHALINHCIEFHSNAVNKFVMIHIDTCSKCSMLNKLGMQSLITVYDLFSIKDALVRYCCVPSLIDSGIFPATPTNPQNGFSLKFMRRMTMLTLQGVNVITIVKSLDYVVGNPAIAQQLYKKLLGCFLIFVEMMMRQQTEMNEMMDKGIMCSPCVAGQKMVIAYDVCFRLKRHGRKENSGPQVSSSVFIPSVSITTFDKDCILEEAYQDPDCTSEFIAVKESRIENRNSKFSENGVGGSVCSRHGIPLLFISLMRNSGEKFAYGKAILHALQQKIQLPIVWSYDVACRFSKSFRGDDNSNLQFVIPKLHIYTHSSGCRSNYNLKMVQGIGDTDGETIERLWSYLSAYYPQTREMTAKNRVNLLSYALIFYAYCKYRSLHYYLKKKLKVSIKLLKELDDMGIVDFHPVPLGVVDPETTIHRECSTLPNRAVSVSAEPGSEDCRFILKTYQRLMVQYCFKKSKKLDSVLNRYETAFEFCRRSDATTDQFLLAFKEFTLEEMQKIKKSIESNIQEILFLQFSLKKPKNSKGQKILQLITSQKHSLSRKTTELIETYNSKAVMIQKNICNSNQSLVIQLSSSNCMSAFERHIKSSLISLEQTFGITPSGQLRTLYRFKLDPSSTFKTILLPTFCNFDQGNTFTPILIASNLNFSLTMSRTTSLLQSSPSFAVDLISTSPWLFEPDDTLSTSETCLSIVETVCKAV